MFFVASRGHHADIGGITPGSMPPHSKSLDEEGATFKSFKLVKNGIFQEKALITELMKPGQIPGSSGTRNLSDNLSDLKAQIAANQKVSPNAVTISRMCICIPDLYVCLPVGHHLGPRTDSRIRFRRSSSLHASHSEKRRNGG